MVVDDSRVTRLFVEKIMAAHARRVISAEGFADALRKVGDAPDLDLVITDVHMAAGDGFELLGALRELSVPVLLMTGRNISEQDRERATALGAVGFIEKPIRARAILEAWEGTQPLRRALAPGRIEATLRFEGERNEPLAVAELEAIDPRCVFVPTEGPLPVGARVELTLRRRASTSVVSGEIVGVRSPGWGREGGVEVRCDATQDPDDGSGEARTRAG